jgi:hypothetical protein
MVAVNWVAETNTVVRAVPLNLTTELDVKLLPLAVRVKLAPPAATEVGLMLVSTGAGGLVMVSVCPEEVPPPGAGVKTVIEGVPAAATSAAVMVAVNCVALTNTVARALPLICTTEFGAKALPLAVSVKLAPPAVAVVGLMLVSTGAGGAVMVSV